MSDQLLHDVEVQADPDPTTTLPQTPTPTSPIQRLADLAQGSQLPGLSVIAIAVLTSDPVRDIWLCYGGGGHSVTP
jgi:hypothetical protein